MATVVFDPEQIRSRLDAASREGSPVLIRYENRSGERSKRRIEPQSTYERSGRYYVRAYCRLRAEMRTFAVRRMELLEEETDKPRNNETASRKGRPAGDAAQAAHSAAAAGSPADGYTAGRAPSGTGPSSGRSPQRTEPQLQLRPLLENEMPSGGQRSSRSGGLLTFLAALFGLLLLVILFDSGLFHPPSPSDADEQPQQAERAEGGESGQESAPPRRWEYRGYEVRRTDSGAYTVPALELSARSGRRIHYIINAALFIRETGIESEQLLQRYAAADRDGNGHLSWSEVTAFQQATARRFRYQHNARALRPDQFLSRGGGDCEDFALYTCGMLQFWGWNCKVATLVPPDGGQGHAVAFVWSARPIPGYGSLRIREGTLASGMRIKPGYWIPIDYEAVGSFTAAVGVDWRLSGVMEPVPLYGRLM